MSIPPVGYTKDSARDCLVRRQLRVDQTPDLPAMLFRIACEAITPNGVFPQHLLWFRSGWSNLYHEAISAPGGVVVARALDILFGGHGASELIFGIDVEEPRALVSGTGLIVAHWKNESWRIGAMQYSASPRLCLPIDWENSGAIRYMQDLIRLYSWRYAVGRRQDPFLIQ